MQQEINTKLTPEQIAQYNKEADSLCAILNEHYKKVIEFNEDMRNNTLVPVYKEHKKEWYMEAQNYVVPAFAVIILTLFIFGFIVLWDSKKGEAKRSKDQFKILEFLDK